MGRRFSWSEDTTWKALAFACRYGHQPLSGLLAMTLRDLNAFNTALNELLGEEAKEAQIVTD